MIAAGNVDQVGVVAGLVDPQQPADIACGQLTAVMNADRQRLAERAAVGLIAEVEGEMVDALALLYPGLKAQVRPGWWSRVRLGLAERLDIRDKLVEIPLQDPALFTGDPDWQQFIRDDPLALREVTSGFLLANLELDRRIDHAVTEIACPLLLMLSGGDRIIDNPATRELFDEFVSPRKRLFEYPEADHTLEFEPGRDGFVDDLVEWLGDVVVAC